jgi:hypothetical protein
MNVKSNEGKRGEEEWRSSQARKAEHEGESGEREEREKKSIDEESESKTNVMGS